MSWDSSPAAQSFLELCNFFYGRFVKDYGQVVRPLHELIENRRSTTPEFEKAVYTG
jgi:hypothetical protein